MDLREVKERGKSVVNRHPWELARLDVVLDYFKKFSIPQNGSLLDLGCGDPWFSEQFSNAHPELKILAVDIAFEDSQMQQYANELKGKNIRLFKTLDEAEAAVATPVDLVLLLDVIEHVENDISFLERLYASSIVSDTTKIIITVPAYQSLFCSHDTFLGHFRRYTNDSLREHVGKAGFSPISINYFFLSLLLPRCFRVLSERMGISPKKTTGLVSWNGSAGVTQLFRSVLWIDYKITSFFLAIGVRLPGLSNIVVCQRAA